MSTPRPWKIGKQQQDGTWCVVTPNHVAEGITHTDDADRYGGNLIAKGLTLENARLVAMAPEASTLLQKIDTDGIDLEGHCSGCEDNDCAGVQVDDVEVTLQAHDILGRVFTGMPS